MTIRKNDRKKVSSRRWIENSHPGYRLRHWKNAPGKPSDYLTHLDDIPPSRPIVLICRVSGRYQDWRNNLAPQVWDAKRRIAKRGHKIIRVIEEVGSGWILTHEGRPKLKKAVKIAKRHNAVIVFYDTDRALRNIDYCHDNDAMPTICEFEKFLKLAKGVQIATILHPDLPRKGKGGIRSHEIKRAQKYKNKKGGRPPKTKQLTKSQRRQQLLEQALDLHSSWVSYRDISAELGVPVMTLHGWVRKYWNAYAQKLYGT
ncbi:recombinase family protein [Bremerella sp. T1]|uniref:recombinase family protein n=1 Tax=Bremerella sp. TYQ1 TaxID=3119568 RepID=UPI001CC9B5A2|nr:recombinase family protein [Bremerella volcania]UBM35203.1 recombinase family protein [Bremerella volcania]